MDRECPIRHSGHAHARAYVTIGVVPASPWNRVRDWSGLRQCPARADGGDEDTRVRNGAASGHAHAFGWLAAARMESPHLADIVTVHGKTPSSERATGWRAKPVLTRPSNIRLHQTAPREHRSDAGRDKPPCGPHDSTAGRRHRRLHCRRQRAQRRHVRTAVCRGLSGRAAPLVNRNVRAQRRS